MILRGRSQVKARAPLGSGGFAPGCAGLPLQALREFLAMHCDSLRRLDAEARLIALHAQHRDGDIISDLQGFADSPGEDQHGCYLLRQSYSPPATQLSRL